MSDMSQADLRQTGHENLRKSACWHRKYYRISFACHDLEMHQVKWSGGLLLMRSHLVQALQMNRVSTVEHADSFRRVE
jgi:hypothetical protein